MNRSWSRHCPVSSSLNRLPLHGETLAIPRRNYSGFRAIAIRSAWVIDALVPKLAVRRWRAVERAIGGEKWKSYQGLWSWAQSTAQAAWCRRLVAWSTTSRFGCWATARVPEILLLNLALAKLAATVAGQESGPPGVLSHSMLASQSDQRLVVRNLHRQQQGDPPEQRTRYERLDFRSNLASIE